MRAHETRTAPEWVAPLVVFLASDRCDRTHRYYSAIRGRYAEAFIGVTDGWVAPTSEPPAPEDIVAHLGTIEDPSGYSVPRDTFDEVAIASRAVEAALGN